MGVPVQSDPTEKTTVGLTVLPADLQQTWPGQSELLSQAFRQFLRQKPSQQVSPDEVLQLLVVVHALGNRPGLALGLRHRPVAMMPGSVSADVV
jgi:hypothetical protein